MVVSRSLHTRYVSIISMVYRSSKNCLRPALTLYPLLLAPQGKLVHLLLKETRSLEPLSPVLAEAQQVLQFWTISEFPRVSDLARKRKVKATPPLGKQRCNARGSGSELKTVTASERVKKHPTSHWWCLQESCSALHAEKR